MTVLGLWSLPDTTSHHGDEQDPVSFSPVVGSLCSGAGMLDLGLAQVIGPVRVAWHAENDPDASKVLARHWPGVPNLGDITSVDWASVPRVDIVTAGFPCQDISYAGRGAGIREGNRSGLWHIIAAALGVLRPRYFVAENVAGIVSRRPGLDVVVADLAALGFAAEWLCVRASDVGAPHGRDRWFCVATNAERGELQRRRGLGQLAGAERAGVRQGPQREQDGHAARDSGATVADADHDPTWHRPRGTDQARRWPESPQCGSGAATYAEGDGRDEGRPEPARLVWRSDAAQRCDEACAVSIDWRTEQGDDYGPAVRRWHDLTRCVPHPTINGRLNPRLNEWMLGLPDGHVTATEGLSRNAQLRILGNGVVPQQAALAVRLLLDRHECPVRLVGSLVFGHTREPEGAA